MISGIASQELQKLYLKEFEEEISDEEKLYKN